MIEKMKFLSITGPKEDIDRVADVYLSRYEIQLENALSELKTVKDLRPYIEINPYKGELDRAKELMEQWPDALPEADRADMDVNQAAQTIRELSETFEQLNARQRELLDKREELVKSRDQVMPFKGLNYDVKEMSTFSENWQALERTIVANKAYMGVSLGFSTMQQFATAYRQALNCASLGREQKPGKCVYYYSEYYIFDMLRKYNESIPLQSVYTSYLDELDDGKGGSFSNLELLYVYLISERNIALTARRVHMHRNGVLYRIQKIHDMLKLNLESPDVRLRLLISFKILEMEGRISLEPFEDADEGGGVTRIE